MTWYPGSDVAGLDSLKFLHVACGLEPRMCQDQTQSNLRVTEGRLHSSLLFIASEEVAFEGQCPSWRPNDDRIQGETWPGRLWLEETDHVGSYAFRSKLL